MKILAYIIDKYLIIGSGIIYSGNVMAHVFEVNGATIPKARGRGEETLRNNVTYRS